MEIWTWVSHVENVELLVLFAVSPSTLTCVYREYGIHRWPPRIENNPINQTDSNESPAIVDQERIPLVNIDTLLPSNQVSATVQTNIATIKARYGNGITIKFQLSLSWKMVELEQQVKKKVGTRGWNLSHQVQRLGEWVNFNSLWWQFKRLYIQFWTDEHQLNFGISGAKVADEFRIDQLFPSCIIKKNIDLGN